MKRLLKRYEYIIGIQKIRTLASESFANDVSLCGDIVSITAPFDAHTCSFSMNKVFDDLRMSAIDSLTPAEVERDRRVVMQRNIFIIYTIYKNLDTNVTARGESNCNR